MPISIGTQAPDFCLKSKTSHGLEDVRLSANYGKHNTLLLFFPFAFTPVCEYELCDLAGGITSDKRFNAEVYGISIDSPYAQHAWADQKEISIKLLSDLDKTVVTAYGLLIPGLDGIGATSARAAVVVDKEGKIVYSERTAQLNDLPDFDAIRKLLHEIM